MRFICFSSSALASNLRNSLVGTLVGLWATAPLTQQSHIECVDGIHIIIARGTLGAQGAGALGLMAERIVDRIEDSSYRAIVYPATFMDPYHGLSVRNGSNGARRAFLTMPRLARIESWPFLGTLRYVALRETSKMLGPTAKLPSHEQQTHADGFRRVLK